jgi:hypothetical protein
MIASRVRDPGVVTGPSYPTYRGSGGGAKGSVPPTPSALEAAKIRDSLRVSMLDRVAHAPLCASCRGAV